MIQLELCESIEVVELIAPTHVANLAKVLLNEAIALRAGGIRPGTDAAAPLIEAFRRFTVVARADLGVV